MDKSLLFIVGIVFVVAATGYWTVRPDTMMTVDNTITANVVREVDPCTQCIGTPVCGGKSGKATNYPSSCAAKCDNARIIFDGYCEQIPRAN